MLLKTAKPGPARCVQRAILTLVALTLLACQVTCTIHERMWLLEIPGGQAEADRVAGQYGMYNLGELPGIPDIYIFERDEVPANSMIAQRIKRDLEQHPDVLWAEQQVPSGNVKRAHSSVEAPRQHQAMSSQLSSLLAGHLQQPQPLIGHTFGQEGQAQAARLEQNLVPPKGFNDELWAHQWYLHHNAGMSMQSDVDLRVREVWELGYTGKDVVVSVIDDGIEWNHTDIRPNYDEKASWDFVNNRQNPSPDYHSAETMNHGTRCAGEIAMVGGNKKCGVGVAYNARIGGIKSLSEKDTPDMMEARALSYNLDHIQIYSISWGPKDNGFYLKGPGRSSAKAIEHGVLHGRQGKGAIYVWANGNGGPMDHCNCDGYVVSIYTIAVGGVSQRGMLPYFGERCASTMAVAASSGTMVDHKIVTTDLHNKCTTEYTGTSASAPLAAGVYALALEANNNLTWRDVQHLTAWTSNPAALRHNDGWKRNAAGLMFNSRFGFGLLDAKAMVDAALKWQTVPKKSICIVSPVTRLPLPMRSRNMLQVVFITDGCQSEYERSRDFALDAPGQTWPQSSHSPSPVIYLEHVQLIVDIDYTVRGDLDIFLVSPSGTVSTMLARRPPDTERDGFIKWPLMSLHFWAETTPGKWTAIVRDRFGQNNRGFVRNLTLHLHGTTTMPLHMSQAQVLRKTSPDEASFIDPKSEFDEEDPYSSMYLSERSKPTELL